VGTSEKGPINPSKGVGILKKAALIIASDNRGLLPVFTVPAVTRLVRLARQTGFDPVFVLGRFEELSPLFSELLSPSSLISLKEGEDLRNLLSGRGISGETRVLALSAHTVVDRRSLLQLLEKGESSGLYMLQGRKKDPDESIFLGNFDDLLPQLESLRKGVPCLEPSGTVQRMEGFGGLPKALEDRPESLGCAEKCLISTLSFQTEADDGFFARHFDRRVSRLFSRRLAHTAMTPNQITLIGVTIGLSGAFLLSLEGYWCKLFGALLFLFCVMVDGVDGEVARLKMQETVFGHYLDIITDNVVHVAVFIGIAFGLYHDSGNSGYLLALWWMLGGFGLCIVAVYQCILRKSPEELERSPRLLRFLALLSNRDFAYLVALLALLQRLNWFLLGAAAGTYLFAGALWLLSFYEARQPLPKAP
jgi:phosphatidylglycerophosphate synthase